MRSSTAVRRAVLVAALLAGTVGPTLDAVAAAPVKLPSAARTAASSDAHVARRAVTARVASALGPGGEIRGMVLNDQNYESRGILGNIPEFPKMAKEGITSIAIYLYVYVATPTSNEVSSGVYTPSDTELQVVAAAAQASGLAVQFMPILLNSQNIEGRSTYVPTDVNVFFASYTTQIVHYADLAKSLGVSLFYVGSENRPLEKYTAQWRALIAATREHYSGALSYMSIPSTFTTVKFWDRLDLAAVSPYVSMGTDLYPTYERDVAAWTTVHSAYFARLAAYAKIPLVYGEAGFNSQAGSFSHPAYSETPRGAPAPAAQADAYRALLDVLAKTPGIYGVTWFRWVVGSTPLDMGYSPAGKPAECVLAAHWSTDATVRMLASQRVCDLHALDAAMAGLAIPSVHY